MCVYMYALACVCVCVCAFACMRVRACIRAYGECVRVRAYLVDESLVERARVVQLVPQRTLQLRRGRARATAPAREDTLVQWFQ